MLIVYFISMICQHRQNNAVAADCQETLMYEQSHLQPLNSNVRIHDMTKLLKKLKRKVVTCHQLWHDSYIRLRMSGHITKGQSSKRSVSVAIPFYNNSAMGHLALFNIINDERVSEIVILDDFSDVKEFEKLKRKVAPFHKKVKLYRRDKNWGGFCKQNTSG